MGSWSRRAWRSWRTWWPWRPRSWRSRCRWTWRCRWKLGRLGTRYFLRRNINNSSSLSCPSLNINNSSAPAPAPGTRNHHRAQMARLDLFRRPCADFHYFSDSLSFSCSSSYLEMARLDYHHFRRSGSYFYRDLQMGGLVVCRSGSCSYRDFQMGRLVVRRSGTRPD